MKGLRQPFVTDCYELAEYYAGCEAEKSRSAPIVLGIDADEALFRSLRYDGAAMDESVTFDDRTSDQLEADTKDEIRLLMAKRPEWVKDGLLVVPDTAWNISLCLVRSAWMDAVVPPPNILLPGQAIGGPCGPLEPGDPFVSLSGLPEPIRAEAMESVAGAFSQTLLSRSVWNRCVKPPAGCRQTERLRLIHLLMTFQRWNAFRMFSAPVDKRTRGGFFDLDCMVRNNVRRTRLKALMQEDGKRQTLAIMLDVED
jgi:hypothetical protein